MQVTLKQYHVHSKLSFLLQPPSRQTPSFHGSLNHAGTEQTATFTSPALGTGFY